MGQGMHSNAAFRPSPLLLVLGGLACLSATASLTGALKKPPAEAIPFMIWLPIILSVVAATTSRSVRSYVMQLPPQVMIAVQAIRAPVGAWFLVQGRRGVLPEQLTSLAGIGDIIVGVASVALLLRWKSFRDKAGLLAAWNAIGLLEILAVNFTAMRLVLFSESGEQIRTVMTSFPIVWIPLLLVPCVIGSHFLFFAQLRSR